MLIQHYVLTLDPSCGHVFNWLTINHVDVDVHLNRTRFWLEEGSELYTEFLVRFGHCCPQVDSQADLATGYVYKY